ncbi:hypothetical protein [Mangrovibacillus cuniculi]|uniref:Uncharacterized protein n=1 Tax=Mangrovibacillus cuniculi TaxID=2593652 RepID=A0A7S8C8Y0_9BACI|nr:hypothetical protein [Mangrovibacillus cuniculi]QPC45579.1 hypothetical protein G8O30_00600 [Mangrovibacillus cuniculi]
MNGKNLNRNVLLTLLIGVPLCTLTPLLGLPTVWQFILLPIGIVLCLIGTASSMLMLQRKR